MVDQLPNRGREAEMLQEMGLASMEDLFSDIPANVRFDGELPLPGPQSEEEIISDARRLLGANTDMGSRPSFLGAGLYRNYVPAAVFQLVTRGEFLTAYTPYQPEVSQGMLQAMWEFQTLISELVGLPIANLSLYDGSTAAAEALTCAVRVHNRKASQPNTVYVSSLTPPDKLSVMFNYCQGAEIEIRKLAHNEDGTLDLDALSEAAGSCGVYLEQPNPLGVLDEGLTSVKEIIGKNTALIVGVQPVSLGVVEAPGHYGADIVVGEGQPLGSPVTGGGPLYGIFACTKPYLRLMPGRIVGRSIDVDGKEAYCLTLSTREQHIRRHRATSNICTNEALYALASTIYMAAMGKQGMKQVAELCYHKSHYAAAQIASLPGYSLPIDKPFFQEFVVQCPSSPTDINKKLIDLNILGGLDVSEKIPDGMLLCVTEMNSKDDIDALVAALSELK